MSLHKHRVQRYREIHVKIRVKDWSSHKPKNADSFQKLKENPPPATKKKRSIDFELFYLGEYISVVTPPDLW